MKPSKPMNMGILTRTHSRASSRRGSLIGDHSGSLPHPYIPTNESTERDYISLSVYHAERPENSLIFMVGVKSPCLLVRLTLPRRYPGVFVQTFPQSSWTFYTSHICSATLRRSPHRIQFPATLFDTVAGYRYLVNDLGIDTYVEGI